MYILDTNICIYIIKKKPAIVFDRFSKPGFGEVGISSITLSELEYGAQKSKYVDQNIKAIRQFVIPLEIYNYDYNAALEYGKIRAYLEKSGQLIVAMDMLIASHT